MFEVFATLLDYLLQGINVQSLQQRAKIRKFYLYFLKFIAYILLFKKGWAFQ